MPPPQKKLMPPCLGSELGLLPRFIVRSNGLYDHDTWSPLLVCPRNRWRWWGRGRDASGEVEPVLKHMIRERSLRRLRSKLTTRPQPAGLWAHELVPRSNLCFCKAILAQPQGKKTAHGPQPRGSFLCFSFLWGAPRSRPRGNLEELSLELQRCHQSPYSSVSLIFVPWRTRNLLDV